MLNIFRKSQEFKLRGTRCLLRMDDEMNSINRNEADSAFKQYKKQYLDTLLKSKGFFKYKTNGYIRRDQVDVLELIKLQKERYGCRTFTVNYALTPLYIPYDYYNFCYSDRIGMLICKKDIWWDFGNEEIAKVSFENVANAIEVFVLPWFDTLSNDDSIKKMLLDKREKNGGRLSVINQQWLDMIEHHNECSGTIEENIKLFALPKSIACFDK